MHEDVHRDAASLRDAVEPCFTQETRHGVEIWQKGGTEAAAGVGQRSLGSPASRTAAKVGSAPGSHGGSWDAMRMALNNVFIVLLFIAF